MLDGGVRFNAGKSETSGLGMGEQVLVGCGVSLAAMGHLTFRGQQS